MLKGLFAAGGAGRVRLVAGAAAVALLAGIATADAQGVLRPGGAVPPPANVVPPPGPPPSSNRDQPSATPAGLITADDENALTREIQGLGYNATLTKDSVGDPKIDGKMSKSPYHIYFYGCDDQHHHCKYIQFVAGWDLKDGITLEQINAWNKDKLWGQAYRDDENDPWISIVYNLDGGVSKANFADTFDWFRVTLEAFEKHINW